ncbi:MAG TPA: DUF2085 domain-containing protein [Chloroflexota bacterium]|nr:DUF2085 domain-containing protein [Chloroflexota bacterium]HUM69665.1 DUF2085 domain-containing protein [Chloroflexota bacterium]
MTPSPSPPRNPKPAVTGWQRAIVLALQKLVYGLARYWYFLFMAAASIFLILGFLAPALQAQGYDEAGTAVYRFLAPHNHQLPQRSYFLFGQSGFLRSYSLEQIIAFGADPQQLQAFTGNAQIGYKTALNHRMIAIFAGMVMGGLVWGLRRGRPSLSLFAFLLFTLPLLLDSFSHMASEAGSGFRDSNNWLVILTGGMGTAVFYTGTTIGTANWWLRTLTGLLFGLGLVWFTFPRFANYFAGVRMQLERKRLRD